MRYAVISDIHGNLHALQAVLADAANQNIGGYLFLGDYIEDFPWPNEVVETVRFVKDAVVIRGNKEQYLADMYGDSKETWIYEQMAPMYWNYRELTEDNMKYLISLPPCVEIMMETGSVIRLIHNDPIFYRKPKIEAFHSTPYRKRMAVKPFTHDEYLTFARNSVLERPEAVGELEALPPGVYAFGHNHVSWHMKYKDKLLINPGSCGMPLDFDTAAPYTIIEDGADGWGIEERRAPYDVETVIDCLKKSELYSQAEIWSRIMICQLRAAGDYIGSFLGHVEQTANNRNYAPRPVSNDIWRKAADTFGVLDIWNDYDGNDEMGSVAHVCTIGD